jgi:hypothetical protein
LTDAKITRQLIAADSVFAIAQHPESGKPFCERDWTILEDRSQFDGELFVTLFALPAFLSLQVVVLLVSAGWADRNTIRPTHLGDSINANLFVAVVLDRLLECLWRFHVDYPNPNTIG